MRSINGYQSWWLGSTFVFRGCLSLNNNRWISGLIQQSCYILRWSLSLFFFSKQKVEPKKIGLTSLYGWTELQNLFDCQRIKCFFPKSEEGEKNVSRPTTELSQYEKCSPASGEIHCSSQPTESSHKSQCIEQSHDFTEVGRETSIHWDKTLGGKDNVICTDQWHLFTEKQTNKSSIWSSHFAWFGVTVDSTRPKRKSLKNDHTTLGEGEGENAEGELLTLLLPMLAQAGIGILSTWKGQFAMKWLTIKMVNRSSENAKLL